MGVRTDPYNAGITWLDEPLTGAGTGPLAGRTLLVKDLVDTAGVRTTYGSKIYADHVPDRHAVVVERALAAGATLIGKANLVEFAWGVLGQNEWYGTVHNPVRPGRTTGGSSSGNGAALAAGLCDLAIGTDTGCSVRLPAAACEIVGLKPRHGLVPEDGVFPLCPSFDTVGPMARSVADVATLWSVLAARPVPEPELAGRTVGLLRRAPDLADGRDTEKSDAAEQWVTRLESLGARVVEATVPGPAASLWPVFDHEAARSHAATFPSRAEEYGRAIRTKLEADPATSTPRPCWRATVRWSRGVSSSRRSTSTRALRRDRLAGGGRKRVGGAAAALFVHALGQPARLGRPRDRQSPACRAEDEVVLAAGLAWEQG